PLSKPEVHRGTARGAWLRRDEAERDEHPSGWSRLPAALHGVEVGRRAALARYSEKGWRCRDGAWIVDTRGESPRPGFGLGEPGVPQGHPHGHVEPVGVTVRAPVRYALGRGPLRRGRDLR